MEPITEIQQRIIKLAELRKDFLIDKNKKYGNSALDPIGIFGKHVNSEDVSINGILVRIDDKLTRIRNSQCLRANDVIDLAGYLDLLIIAKDWDKKEVFEEHKE